MAVKQLTTTIGTSKILALALMLFLFPFSATCLAETVPAVIFDNPSCEIKDWHDRGGSFQNKTGDVIVKQPMKLRLTIYFTDKRSPLVGNFDVGKFRVDHCAVVSTSAAVLKHNHIAKETSELVGEQGVLDGCQFEISESAAIPSHLVLVKSDKAMKCQFG